MPKRRQDSNSDKNSSSSSSEDDSSDSSVSKRSHHKRSRTDHKLKSSPARIVRYSKDYKQPKEASGGRHKEDSGGRKERSENKYKSSDSYRQQSPAQESRRVYDKGDSRKRDRQDHSDRRDKDIDRRQFGSNRDRAEHRQRSRDREIEKSRNKEDAKRSSYSKDRGGSSKVSKENEAYISKRADSGRKDKDVTSSDTRKERNEDEKTQKSSSKDSNEKEEPRSQQPINLQTDDRSRKDESREELEKLKQQKDTSREKKRKESTSSSSSSSSEADNKSSSDSDSDSDDSNRNYTRVKANKESVNVLIQQKELGKPAEDPKESDERVVSIVEETEHTQKDTVDRRKGSDCGPCSDTSEDESKESKPKDKDCHTAEEGVKNEHQNRETEDENKVTAEKQQSEAQETQIISESKDDGSNEEKEEGELSEDNEDKPPDKPLKGISEYVSDISSDEGQPEATESKKDQNQKTTSVVRVPVSSYLQGVAQTSRDPCQSAKENEETSESSHKSSKVDRPNKLKNQNLKTSSVVRVPISSYLQGVAEASRDPGQGAIENEENSEASHKSSKVDRSNKLKDENQKTSVVRVPISWYLQDVAQTSHESARENEEHSESSHKSSKVDRPNKRTVVLSREAAGVDKRVLTVKTFGGGDVVEGEDNSKRPRPLLESDSSEDDSAASDKDGGVRSQIHGKQKMGSSVSVVKQNSGSKRDRSVDRSESEEDGKKDEMRRKDDSRKREKDDRGRERTDNRAREKDNDKGKGRDDSHRREKDDSLVRRREDTRGRNKEREDTKGREKEREDIRGREKEREDTRVREKEREDRGRGKEREDIKGRDKDKEDTKGRDKERDDIKMRDKDRENIKGRDKDKEDTRGKDDSRGKQRDDNQGKDRKDDRKKDNSFKDTNSTHDNQDKNENKGKEPSVKPSKADSSNPAPTTEESGKKSLAAFDITTKTGGAYIPPAKLRMMQELITDKTSVAYQRMSWEALKKSINGLINKVNISNIIDIIKELFQENIVRGRGLLARSVIQAQAASPTFTHVYAALVAIINTRFPQNGELILRRLILMFRRGFKRNDKALCLSSTMFIAHLVNQQVAHEILALEILALLLENPTNDSVEVAIGFLKECGQKLTDVSPRGINSIFERLRNILHEGQLDVRVQYMVEVMFAIRKDGFKDHPAVLPDLDKVEEDEQFTHMLQLEDIVAGDELLNVFKEDPAFAENEEKYKVLKKEILDEGSSDESAESSGSESSEIDSEDEEKANAEKQTIIDKTETNLVALRRTIYLTVQSSLDHNECAHKMLKMDLKPGQEVELCNMILDCCAQLRTYEKFFGLLGQRFCQIDKKYIEPFQRIFMEQYDTIHRLETNKVRNVAKFFAHLLYTDAISWGVLSVVKLTEEDTSSASRIFLKILFQELSEYMGLLKLNERLKDVTLSPFFSGFMAKDNPKNTRFCINFFTTIGLGGLTDDLREHLKTSAKHLVQAAEQAANIDESSGSSSDSSSDQSDSDSSSDSDSDSPSKKKRKSSDDKTEKDVGKKDSRSHKNAADKENSRASKQKRKSLEREDNSESRSKSSGKGSRQMSERNSTAGKSKNTIGDRLQAMAEYGNIQNGDDRSMGRREDRLYRDVSAQGSKSDEGRDRQDERGDHGDDVRNRENSERLGESRKKWNNSSERGVGRRDDSVGYGKKGENRGQKTQRQDDYTSERRLVRRSASAKKSQSENDRENTNKDKVSSLTRRVFKKGEKGKEKRHDSSSSYDSDSSLERVKKRSVKDRSVSSSPEKRGSKRVVKASKGGKKRRHKSDTSDSDSDSSDDSRIKSSKSKKAAVRKEKK
ncbi:hypothetical protein BsWGS_18499 [Bradybaena similaris]